MVTIQFSGLPAMTLRLQRLASQALTALVPALDAEARTIYQHSQHLVPVDTTLLQLTGEVEPAVATGTVVEAGVRYGGHGRAPYATLQEFDTTLNHPRGGQHHYLSQPHFAVGGSMLPRLADKVRAALRV